MQKNSGACSETDESSNGVKMTSSKKDFLYAFTVLTQDLISPIFLEFFFVSC